MVTAVSAIANGGNYVKPRVVKSIIDEKTKEIQEIEIVREEGIISKQTSENVLSMMQSVVAEGTGKNAQVAGFSIGGKTGTSEDGVNTGKYVTSFIGTAPIEDPEIVILITLYNPTGEGGHQGGGVAAPVASQVLGEVLPYLEVKKISDVDIEEQVIMPNIEGISIKEAEKIIKELCLEIKIEEGVVDKENTIIKEQIPKAGVKINKWSKIIVKY